MKNSRLLILCLVTLLPAAVRAGPELCEAAARQASAETGVPLDVLTAIALAETGRSRGGRLRPWPWAANLEGQGHWFDTREAALEFALAALTEGRDSLDLGCFQINWRWHGEAFASPQALLDPLAGARHAARLLAGHYRETGDWADAAGVYHSRTPHLSARYRARFADLRAALAPDPTPPPPALPAARPPPLPLLAEAADPPTARVNRYPLLVPPADGAPAPRIASLFPADMPRNPAFLPALDPVSR